MEKKENKFIPNEISEDKKLSLRPKKITEFVGQDNIKSNLKTFIESSIKTKKSSGCNLIRFLFNFRPV